MIYLSIFSSVLAEKNVEATKGREGGDENERDS